MSVGAWLRRSAADRAALDEHDQPSREEPRPPLVALQQSAGNAAVARLMRNAPAAVARKGELPEDADQLEDVAPAAKRLTIDDSVAAVGPLKPWLTAARGTDRKGLAVEIRFPGAMAKDTATADQEAKVKKALGALGMSLFNLSDSATEAAKLDVVRFADLDFSPYGGVDGHYRFTCVTRTPKKGKQDAQVDLIIELVREVAPAFTQWSTMKPDRRNALESRFVQAGFVKAEPDALRGDVFDTWTNEQYGLLLQAIEKMPDATLAAVKGIRWERGHGNKGPTGEGGHYSYNPNTGVRRLVIFDGAFGSDEQLTALVAHELGHALSFKPAEKKGTPSDASSKAFKDALKADGGKAITDYAGKDARSTTQSCSPMFVAEPETLRVLRPKVYAFFLAHA